MTDETVTFAEILILVTEGAWVTRKRWIDTQTFIYCYVKPSGIPQLRIRNKDGSSSKWLPKTKDLFAADWYEVHKSVT